MSKRYDVGGIVPADTVRATIYLDGALHQALRVKAATAHRSISDIVNAAVRAAMQEDEEDLAAFESRLREKPLSYDAFRAELDGDASGLRYVYWQDDEFWLGYLEEFPDYWTQGVTREELEDQLRDLYGELTSGRIPNVRRVAQLDMR